MGVNPNEGQPKNWAADLGWLRDDVKPVLDAAIVTIDESGVFARLEPYLEAIEADRKLPLSFRQHVIDLNNAYGEIVTRIQPRIDFLIEKETSGLVPEKGKTA